jgi:hypothetical protein
MVYLVTLSRKSKERINYEILIGSGRGYAETCEERLRETRKYLIKDRDLNSKYSKCESELEQ